MATAQTASLRDTVINQIGAFLYEEKFPSIPFTVEGIFEVINLIADYQEEGKVLFPEVLITNGIELLNTIPDIKVEIGELPASVAAYQMIIKSCATLCTSEWVIYIDISASKLKYGLSCAQLTETTPSLFTQTVGNIKVEIPGCAVAYIHNIGKKTVELRGLRSNIKVSLSLSDPSEISNNEIRALAENICHQLKGNIAETAKNYFEKILSDGFKEGHGNLIGIVDKSTSTMDLLKKDLPDGSYLPKPIDLVEILSEFENDKSGRNSVILRQYSRIIKSMFNSDGITVFSNDGKLIGFHLILKKDFLDEKAANSINGGARTHTFYNMKASGLFVFGFIKSQDGPIKTFSTHE